MSPDESVTHWLNLLQGGDPRAAQQLWERYFHRLVGLARAKLQGHPRRAADEEDVALSVFRCLCEGASRGRFPELEDRDDLWRLLVTLTERKAYNLARDERRLKRGGGAVVGEGGSPDDSDPGVRRRGGRGVPPPPGPAGQRRATGHRGVEDGGRHGPGDRRPPGLCPEHGRAPAAADPPYLGKRGGPLNDPVSQDETRPLPLPLARRVDEACWRFEGASNTASSGAEPPRLEAYLAEVPEPAQTALRRELLKVEAHYRRGAEPRGDDSPGRLPDLGPSLPHTVLEGAGAGRPARGAAAIPHWHPAGGSSPVPGYEVLGGLGWGGMGVVYLARQVKLNRVVALKTIQGGQHIGPKARQRFQREAEAVAQLQHPNIIQVFEVGEHDGRPYLALEYVPGGSLDQRLRGTPQPAHVAARLVRALALAVHHA